MSKWLSGFLTLMVFSVLVVSFLFLTPALSLSAQVKMKWDGNKPAPTGYRIFQRTLGQAYNYKKPVWEGSATTATIGTLEKKTKYFFVVRAFKGAKESADSNEIAFISSSPVSPGTSAAAKPTITPDGGKFSGSVKVSLTSTTSGAKIYYTTNGKTPTTKSTRYRKPFTLKKKTRVKAFAVAAGYKNSPMARAKFTKSGAATSTAAKPRITPGGGKFSGSVKVSLKSATSGAKIYYTTNGKTPTKRSTLFKKPFTLKKNTTVKAFAMAAGYKNSPMARARFTRAAGGKTAAAVLTPITSDEAAAKVQQQPYGGKPWPIPGTIEAEDYDTGGEAAAYHDTTEGNRGGRYRKDGVDIWYSSDRYSGHYTGANTTGEWLEYSVKVAASGMYSLDLNVATPKDNRKMRVMLDGKDITGPIRLPNTGGWKEWETVMTTVHLKAGKHALRVMFDRGGLNFNWIDINPIGP